jgi:hypothetical protein
MTPVERTLKLIRAEGGHPETVEKWIPRGHGFKLDLFGVVDIEALFPDHTLYVQVCRDTDLTDHLVTCIGEPRLLKLIECQARVFEIWSWAKKGNRWRERRLTAEWTPAGVVFVEYDRGTPAVSPVTPMRRVQTSAQGER